MFSVQINKTIITSLEDFTTYQGEVIDNIKEAVFTLQQGTDENSAFINNLTELDIKLSQQDIPYLRVNLLDSFFDNNDRDKYTKLYDEFSANCDTESFKTSPFIFSFNNQDLDENYKKALIKIIAEYDEQMKSDLKKRSLALVLFKWINDYFPKIFTNTDEIIKLPKFVFTGIIKANELMFLNLLAHCGCDVFAINLTTATDIKLDLSKFNIKIITGKVDITTEICEYDKEKVIQNFSQQMDTTKTRRERTMPKIKVRDPNAPEIVRIPIRANSPESVQTPNTAQQENEITYTPIEQIPQLPNDNLPTMGNETPTKAQKITIQPPRKPQNPVSRDTELSYIELANIATSIVMITVLDDKNRPVSSGSGVIINSDGYVVTNSHVVAGGRIFSIRLENSEEEMITTRLVKYNQDFDLALLRIEPVDRPAVPIYDREDLVRGQKVVAIGSPLGLFNTVSDGIIAGFRKFDKMSMIQFTAPTSSGSSGGALLNLHGELIGIVTAGYSDGQNLNLAVDNTTLTDFLRGFI